MSLDPIEPFPAYAFVPGGPWPHPNRSSQGHSYGRVAPTVDLADRGDGSSVPQFRRGVELFNAGYYWEAHEVWEALWHAYGRRGPQADVVKGLIKLAAAGVKVREGHEHGVRTHAGRAAALFAAVKSQTGRYFLGIDLDALIAQSRAAALAPPRDPGPPDARVVRVFAFGIEAGMGNT